MTNLHNSPVIVSGARTPVGRFMGSLSNYTAADLGSIAIRGALQRAGLDGGLVQYVVMGQVLTAGAGQVPARRAAIAAGIPMSVPAINVNMVCLSGLEAIASAAQLVSAGAFDIVVAGGQESMSRAPHLLLTSRTGTKYGNTTLVDHLAHDGLYDAYTGLPMGTLTDQHNADEMSPVSRADQDAYAAMSHERAATATADGLFDEEIAPVQIDSARRHQAKSITADEAVRPDVSMETLSRLPLAFSELGTITAATASPLSDGAAAVVIMSKGKAIELGLQWLAEISAHAVVAGPDSSLQHQPSRAITAACAKAGVMPTSLDLAEINEAFAAVAITSTRDLGLDPQKVNVNGGAIAIGHPLGMSGARITLHLALQMQRQQASIGAAALCGGGGQGSALILSVG
ncbi:acetyl-CoA C-acyltransferase [Mycolicibacterium nivoides]|uniref:acetyl-CoA C-acyltransferase n=1 Tax=Mycolicibacterium nivoides TaxID=2487344 RepID=UPI003C2BB1C4